MCLHLPSSWGGVSLSLILCRQAHLANWLLSLPTSKGMSSTVGRQRCSLREAAQG